MLHHVVGPEPHDSEALGAELCISIDIMARLDMLASVAFHNQTVLVRDEVADVATNRLLASELRREVAPEVIPEKRLRFREVATDFPGSAFSEWIP